MDMGCGPFMSFKSLLWSACARARVRVLCVYLCVHA